MPTWTRLAKTPIQRSSQTLAVVSNHAFIYGGELRPREPVDSAMHRIRTSTSTSKSQDNDNNGVTSLTPSTTPTPRVGTASTTLTDKIYIFSGRGGTAMAPIEESGSFWVFDTTSGSWAQVYPADPTRPYPPGRSYHALTSNAQDTIFLHAGCPEKGRLSDLWAFNVQAREWTELPSAPGPARGGPSIAYVGGQLFRMNGFDGKTEQGGAIDVFDFASGSWSSITYSADGVSGPVPRSVACLVPVVVSGKVRLVTMFGEHDPSSLGHEGAGKMLKDVWAFDVEGRKWEEVKVDSAAENEDEKPVARGWFAADAGDAGVIVHGGLAESNERLGDVWRLDF